MKKLIIIILAILTLSSCFKDDRNNFLPDESLYILNPAYSETKIDKQSIELTIIKSGKGRSEADVQIVIDDQALAAYNALNSESFLALPENVLEFSSQNIHFSKNDFRKQISISWTPAAVSALIKIQEYVIPISITSSDLGVDEQKSFIIVKPVE